MSRRLRIEVVDCDAALVFVGDVGGNFTVDNLLEYCFIAHVRRLKVIDDYSDAKCASMEDLFRGLAFNHPTFLDWRFPL